MDARSCAVSEPCTTTAVTTTADRATTHHSSGLHRQKHHRGHHCQQHSPNLDINYQYPYNYHQQHQPYTVTAVISSRAGGGVSDAQHHHLHQQKVKQQLSPTEFLGCNLDSSPPAHSFYPVRIPLSDGEERSSGCNRSNSLSRHHKDKVSDQNSSCIKRAENKTLADVCIRKGTASDFLPTSHHHMTSTFLNQQKKFSFQEVPVPSFPHLPASPQPPPLQSSDSISPPGSRRQHKQRETDSLICNLSSPSFSKSSKLSLGNCMATLNPHKVKKESNSRKQQKIFSSSSNNNNNSSDISNNSDSTRSSLSASYNQATSYKSLVDSTVSRERSRDTAPRTLSPQCCAFAVNDGRKYSIQIGCNISAHSLAEEVTPHDPRHEQFSPSQPSLHSDLPGPNSVAEIVVLRCDPSTQNQNTLPPPVYPQSYSPTGLPHDAADQIPCEQQQHYQQLQFTQTRYQDDELLSPEASPSSTSTEYHHEDNNTSSYGHQSTSSSSSSHYHHHHLTSIPSPSPPPSPPPPSHSIPTTYTDSTHSENSVSNTLDNKDSSFRATLPSTPVPPSAVIFTQPEAYKSKHKKKHSKDLQECRKGALQAPQEQLSSTSTASCYEKELI